MVKIEPLSYFRIIHTSSTETVKIAILSSSDCSEHIAC